METTRREGCGFREEFRLNKLSFNHHQEKDFYHCQWRVPHFLFVTIRFALLVYALFGFVYLGVEFPDSMMKYFTTWSYILLTLHLGLAAFLSLLYYRDDLKPTTQTIACHIYPNRRTPNSNRLQNQIESSTGPKSMPVWSTAGHSKSREVTTATTTAASDNHACELGEVTTVTATAAARENATNCASKTLGPKGENCVNNSSDQTGDMIVSPAHWYFKMSWCLSTITSLSAPIVTIIFFTTIYPNDNNDGGLVDLQNTNIHILNFVFVLLDHVISARPVRILHSYVAAIYGVAYCLFSVIYWSQDHENNVVYKILDWNTPGMAVGVCIGLVLVLPMLQTAYFGLYRLKLRLLKRVV